MYFPASTRLGGSPSGGVTTIAGAGCIGVANDWNGHAPQRLTRHFTMNGFHQEWFTGLWSFMEVLQPKNGGGTGW